MAPPSIATGGRPLTETDSIVASNTATAGGSICDGDVLDGLHNVAFGSPGCPGATGDPNLGPLQNNGGPTLTMAIGPGSSAIGLVPVSACDATSDQRGIHRPYDGQCDAGAYEAAPPQLGSASASATGPRSATIMGQVTPNLTDTRVVVDYGASTRYGARHSRGRRRWGADATPFSVLLTGLKSHTTYHAKVVVTNTDGATSSGDLTFTTPVAMTASVSGRSIRGSEVAVRILCTAHGPSCKGALKLTSHLTISGGRVVAVAARTVKRTVGVGRYSVPSGRTKIVKLSLNRTGKRLLKARRRLPTTLTTSGPPRITKRVTFVYLAKRPRIAPRATVTALSQGD